jgi:hypothetical protein
VLQGRDTNFYSLMLLIPRLPHLTKIGFSSAF